MSVRLILSKLIAPHMPSEGSEGCPFCPRMRQTSPNEQTVDTTSGNYRLVGFIGPLWATDFQWSGLQFSGSFGWCPAATADAGIPTVFSIADSNADRMTGTDKVLGCSV